MITRVEKGMEKGLPLDSKGRLFSKPFVLVTLHILIFASIVFIDGLDYRSKVALFAFLSAMTLWITTKIPAGFVAVSLLCSSSS